MSIYCESYSDYEKMAKDICHYSPKDELGVNKVSLLSLFTKSMGFKSSHDLFFTEWHSAIQKKALLDSFSGYFVFAVKVIQVANGRIKISVDNLLNLIARAKGFDSVSEFKAALDQAAVQKLPRNEAALFELQYALSAFFLSSNEFSNSVRFVVSTEMLGPNVSSSDLVQKIGFNHLDRLFAAQYSSDIDNEDMLNFFVRIHGDDAFKDILSDREEALASGQEDFLKQSFVNSVMRRVQRISFEKQFMVSVNAVLVELERAFRESSKTIEMIRKNHSDVFSSVEFTTELSDIIKRITIEE